MGRYVRQVKERAGPACFCFLLHHYRVLYKVNQDVSLYNYVCYARSESEKGPW